MAGTGGKAGAPLAGGLRLHHLQAPEPASAIIWILITIMIWVVIPKRPKIWSLHFAVLNQTIRVQENAPNPKMNH